MMAESVDLPLLNLNARTLGALGRTYEEKILGQDHATTTNPRLVYEVPAGKRAIIYTVNVANSDLSAREWSLYIDASGGTTYDKTTKVIAKANIIAEETEIITNANYAVGPGIKVAWDADLVDELTITLFGVEIEDIDL